MPVKNIINVPTSTTAGVPLTLTYAVDPAYATNTDAVWSVVDAGGTGASITGNVLNTTAAGTVNVLATIKDGLLTADYTQNFTITVNPFIEVTDIVGEPIRVTTVKKPLTMTATVVPSNAAVQAITWSVKDGGGTGASFNGNVLNTTDYGIVTVTATVKGGLTGGGDFSRDFTVLVDPIVVGDGELLSAGKPAKASSVEGNPPNPNYVADRVTNGVYRGFDNRWSSQFSDPQWIYIDLEDDYIINKVDFYWQDSHAKTFKIQVSDDANNWTDVTDVLNGVPTPGGWANSEPIYQSVEFDPVQARYVRMYCLTRTTNYGCSIFQMEVFGGTGNSFIPVEDIVGVPAAATAGVPCDLTGLVFPTVSTYTDVTWSIINGGGTGATISGNTLSATNAGTVTVMATVENGKAEGTDFTKTFSIQVDGEAASGVTVTGFVNSYNPGQEATVQLLPDGGGAPLEIAVSSRAGSGQSTQAFSFENVAPGTYTLVVTKPCHTSFTLHSLVVGTEPVDLSQDSRDNVKTITLLCGDISGDGMVNDGDLAILWLASNYNKSASDPGVNELCDLNNDGMINDSDLAILWLASNYNKGSTVI